MVLRRQRLGDEIIKNVAFDKSQNYLRKGVQKIEIEEHNLEFVEGVAIAKANVYCYKMETNFGSYKKPKLFMYSCEGLVTEDYKEAFVTNAKENPAKYFMFLESNRKITRFGTNDFIVEHVNKEQGKLEKSYAHIKLIYNKPYIIEENKQSFSFTSISDIVILDFQLYIVSSSKFYGPSFLSLKEDCFKPGEFIVEDKIVIPSDNNFLYPIVDVLTFRMNQDLQVVSFVFSMIEEGPLYFLSNDYNEIRIERINQLLEKRNWFKEQSLSLERTFHKN